MMSIVKNTIRLSAALETCGDVSQRGLIGDGPNFCSMTVKCQNVTSLRCDYNKYNIVEKKSIFFNEEFYEEFTENKKFTIKK